jgi:restriction endonuclease Mrr
MVVSKTDASELRAGAMTTGAQLVKLMVELGVGVRKKQVEIAEALDEAFFDDLGVSEVFEQ